MHGSNPSGIGGRTGLAFVAGSLCKRVSSCSQPDRQGNPHRPGSSPEEGDFAIRFQPSSLSVLFGLDPGPVQRPVKGSIWDALASKCHGVSLAVADENRRKSFHQPLEDGRPG
jgi:hypothetical protein